MSSGGLTLTLHARSAPRRSARLQARSLPRARRQRLSREESQGREPRGPDLDCTTPPPPRARLRCPSASAPWGETTSYVLSLTPILPARDPGLSTPTPDHSRRRVSARAAFELLTFCQVPSDERNENTYFFPRAVAILVPNPKRGSIDSKSGGGEGQARIFSPTPQKFLKIRVTVKVAG